jgi:hypothetical protein
MTEHDLVDACQDTLGKKLPGVFLYKIADRFTAGVPDLEVNWNFATTKIEFKYLKPGEVVDEKFEPGQLPTCIKYEKATGRCWIVAYQQQHRREPKNPITLIYRPTYLMKPDSPRVLIETSRTMDSSCLWSRGVLRFEGFDHEAVAQLIYETHR